MQKLSAGAILALAICSLPSYAQEGSVVLDVCNKGNVDIDVFIAQDSQVTSSHITPLDCERVYRRVSGRAYVGFAFVDSRGQWGAAHRLDLLPDGGIGAYGTADQNVIVPRGNSKVSLPMQVLFRPRDPICRQINYVQTPGERKAVGPRDPIQIYRKCEDLHFSLNVTAYPDTREITFPDQCAKCSRVGATGYLQMQDEPPEGPQGFYRVNWNDLPHFLSLLSIQRSSRSGEKYRNIVVRGTVSRVEGSPPESSPHWVKVYFREAPNRDEPGMEGTFHVISSPAIFQEKFGADFRSSMMGKTLEVEGQRKSSEMLVTLLHQLRGTGTAAADRLPEEVLHKELEQWSAELDRESAKIKATEDSLRRSIADYDPKWVGQELIVKGTVSRVELKPAPWEKEGARATNRPGQWVKLYFRESPEGAFVVCIQDFPLPGRERGDELGRVGGADFSGLVGKTIEVTGKVQLPLAELASAKSKWEKYRDFRGRLPPMPRSPVTDLQDCADNSAVMDPFKTHVFTEGKTPEPAGSKGPSPVSANPGRVPTPGQPVQVASTTPALTLPPSSTRPPVQPAPARGAPAQAVPPAPSAAGLDEIIELVKGGMSEALVIRTIQRQGKAYDLTPADLVTLHQAGVSEKIIEAMLDSTAASGATPSAAVPSQQGKSSPAPGQATPPATAAPDNSDVAAARAKALEEQRDRMAQQRAAAQQQAKQRAEEAQKTAQRTAACMQQVTKAHPDAGRRDPNVSKEILACIQAQ